MSGTIKVPHPQNSKIWFGVSTAKINSAKIDFFGISICKNKFLKNFFCKNSFFKVSIPYVIVLPFPLPQLLPSLSLFQIYLPGEGIIERLEKQASSSFSIIHKSKIEKSIDKDKAYGFCPISVISNCRKIMLKNGNSMQYFVGHLHSLSEFLYCTAQKMHIILYKIIIYLHIYTYIFIYILSL